MKRVKRIFCFIVFKKKRTELLFAFPFCRLPPSGPIVEKPQAAHAQKKRELLSLVLTIKILAVFTEREQGPKSMYIEMLKQKRRVNTESSDWRPQAQKLERIS